MKKILLTAAFAALGIFSTQAQTEKGNWMFGGATNFSFNSNNQFAEYDGVKSDEETKISNIEFSVDGNYFIIDNLAVGLELLIGSSKETIEYPGGEEEFKSSSFGIAPQATYFFAMDSKFSPFVGAQVGYMGVSAGEQDENKFSGLMLGAEAGIAYFLNQNVSVNFAVQYSNISLSNKKDSNLVRKMNGINLGLGFSIFL